jgi:ElaB/YqjD/DUF883 family membrane-anchored ribosome-binding protein
MAEQAELIQQQMDETRSNLADKLEKLGEQITGTVEKVSDTVEETVEAVSETVETVAETTQETVHAVKEAFNLPKHIQQNPWLWFGGSLALGFLGGRMFLGGSSRREHDHDHHHDHGRGHVDLKMPSSFDTTPPRSDGTSSSAAWDASALEEAAEGSRAEGDTDRHEDSSHEESRSWLGTLAEKFGPQIDTLKQLAVGSLFGVARDMVAQALPESMKLDVSKVIDEMTQNAGGKPIQGSLIEKSDEHEDGESNEGEGQEGDDGKEGRTGNRKRDTGNQSSSERWDRPHERQKQSTERQGQSAGQSKKRR